jgi:hypothetical protein
MAQNTHRFFPFVKENPGSVAPIAIYQLGGGALPKLTKGWVQDSGQSQQVPPTEAAQGLS